VIKLSVIDFIMPTLLWRGDTEEEESCHKFLTGGIGKLTPLGLLFTPRKHTGLPFTPRSGCSYTPSQSLAFTVYASQAAQCQVALPSLFVPQLYLENNKLAFTYHSKPAIHFLIPLHPIQCTIGTRISCIHF
jgi:hypothetical protein